MVTYYQGNRILNRDFNNTAYTVPSTYYISLSTTPYQIDGTGGTEPSGGGYARLAVTSGTTNFTTSTLNILSNKITLQFAQSTASWGVITDIGIYDSLTGGNLLYADNLTTPVTVQNNTTLIFDVGAIQIKMTSV